MLFFPFRRFLPALFGQISPNPLGAEPESIRTSKCAPKFLVFSGPLEIKGVVFGKINFRPQVGFASGFFKYALPGVKDCRNVLFGCKTVPGCTNVVEHGMHKYPSSAAQVLVEHGPYPGPDLRCIRVWREAPWPSMASRQLYPQRPIHSRFEWVFSLPLLADMCCPLTGCCAHALCESGGEGLRTWNWLLGMGNGYCKSDGRLPPSV